MSFSDFKGFGKSKVASRKIISDVIKKGALVKPGNYNNSNALKTTSNHENSTSSSKGYGMSNAGGSSGDGPTPGFTGSGYGVDTLNNAQT